ncbi:MAG: SDR family oxidoreductase [Bdellovibrionota bacterium]
MVCGASQGIGKAIAIEIARLGGRVVVLARSEDKLSKTLSELEKSNDHFALACDLMDLEQLDNKLNQILERTGPIEVLVCNSGGPKGGPLIEAEDAEFLAGFTNHILASERLVRHLLPGMKERSYGRIINIISTSVKAPIPNLGVSNVIRGAVANWAKTLSMELAPFAITVNNVLPGYTQTPRLDALVAAAAKRRDLPVEKIIKEWEAKVPLGRFAQPEEVAAAAAFLASPAAGYINGINLPVDGGRTGSL